MPTLLVKSLKAVLTKEIPLRLNDICRATALPHTVIKPDSTRQSWCRVPATESRPRNRAQTRHRAFQLTRNLRRFKQLPHAAMRGISFSYIVQQRRADNTPRAPYLRNSRKIQRPVIRLCRLLQNAKSLSISQYPPRHQRLFNLLKAHGNGLALRAILRRQPLSQILLR